MSDQNHPKNRKECPHQRIVEVLSDLLTASAEPMGDSQKGRWEFFYTLWGQRLTWVAAAIKTPRDRIEDLTQNVFLKILARWEEFRRPDGARQLLALSHKMMHDEAVDLLRRLDRRSAESLDGILIEPVDMKAGDPADTAAAMELREWVQANLERLEAKRPKYAWVLHERFLEGRPIKELAAEKGMKKHTVRCLITRALRDLRRLMPDEEAGGAATP